ncbi:sigma-w pathway protein ysdB [Evansella sp. AB-P1]|uniref:sigma-w pathway protein ysdB n=1 Tax=Evansella sp. AB-P1 TaxID=3037653 RepID=UPI00241DEF8B|nr:sigma-w pathway protein ysdB [Evansella sp. AB-P1]MDG5786946.1 sigma-w pathway protein ysdB [Evansella sp. AB-P1]
MTVILFRLFLLIAIGIIVYSIGKYLLDPRRKLEAAHLRGDFFILDEADNVRKNLLFTYRNVMFEGEKFLGATEESLEVTSIMISTEDTDKLQGLSKRDFYFIEKEILIHYPKAEIEWKNPINKLLKRMEKNNQ